MDGQKVFQYARRYGLATAVAIVLSLVAVIPAVAQEPTPTPTATPTPTPYPTVSAYTGEGARADLDDNRPDYPNHGIYQNSEQSIIMSGQLPMPLPRQPARVTLDDIVLPAVDFSTLPPIIANRETVMGGVNTRLVDARATLNAQYDEARALISEVSSLSASLREFVGSPETSITAQAGTRAVTVTGMAQEMAQSITFSISYLRAVSALGPMGLDVVFLFIGLAWIALINFIEWVVLGVVWLWKRIVQAFRWVLDLVRLVLELIRTIRAIIPFM